MKFVVFMALALAVCADVRFLKVGDGAKIRCDNGAGKEITWTGTNLGAYWIHENWMSPLQGDIADDYTARQILIERFGEAGMEELFDAYYDAWITDDDFKIIAARGMNVVRMPVYDFHFMYDNLTMRNDPFRRLDNVIKRAWNYGLYTIIDMHGVPGSQNGQDHSGRAGDSNFWGNQDYKNAAINLWGEIAKHYKGNVAVAGYDLLNEPTGAGDKDQWEIENEFYQRIRQEDPDHIIIIEAVWGWGNLPNPSKYGWTNVVYEFHDYQWNADENGQLAEIKKVVNEKNKYVESYGTPMYIGEFNFFDFVTAWNTAIQTYNENGISWTTWSYKATHGGPNDSWGLYDPTGSAEVPDLRNDDFATIKNKWSQWTTANNFGINTVLDAALVTPADNHCA